jgi:protein-disulfide isomerase
VKSSLKIPSAIVLGGVIIALAVYFSIPHRPGTIAGSGDPALVRPVGSGDHILGNPSAKVMIVEYSDFDCGFCSGFHETLRQIIANEGTKGEVAWVFREFPLVEIHPNALSLARAAECVAEVAGNDAFWKFADALFANQPVAPTRYSELAKVAGVLDIDTFTACYINAAADARINADRQNALDTGASGTPYSLILVAGAAPVVMDGAYPYDAVKQLIDAALTRYKQEP